MDTSVAAALAEAAGASMGDIEFVALMLYSSMTGATRAVLEAGAPAKRVVSIARGVAGALPGICGEGGAVKPKIHLRLGEKRYSQFGRTPLRATMFAIEQPAAVDVNEIIVRPTASPY